MKVSRMKLCSAFVINYPFLLCFQQYKGLRFSKLTLSQMGNKTEWHTQNCLWYYFFHLISIPCIHAAGRPSALLRIPPPCCFFVGFFSPQKKKTSSAASGAWLLQDQAVLQLPLFLSSDEAPPSFQHILINIQFIFCKCKSTSAVTFYASYFSCMLS